jgi:hypothetical protein
MKLTYPFTLADWKAAIRLHARQKTGRRIHFLVYDYVFPSLAALGLISVLILKLTGETVFVDNLVIPVAALVVLAIILPFTRHYALRKSYKEMFPPSDTGPGYSLDINEERILSTRPGLGESTYYWTGICAVAQNQKITLLYISGVQFLGIPVRVMTPEQKAEIDSLIARCSLRGKVC